MPLTTRNRTYLFATSSQHKAWENQFYRWICENNMSVKVTIDNGMQNIFIWGNILKIQFWEEALFTNRENICWKTSDRFSGAKCSSFCSICENIILITVPSFNGFCIDSGMYWTKGENFESLVTLPIVLFIGTDSGEWILSLAERICFSKDDCTRPSDSAAKRNRKSATSFWQLMATFSGSNVSVFPHLFFLEKWLNKFWWCDICGRSYSSYTSGRISQLSLKSII